MTAFDTDRPEDLVVYERRFFFVLKHTLQEVFHADPSLSAEYHSDLLAAPPLQRALALHDDPLDVAAQLTGIPVTRERVALYEDVKQRLDVRTFTPSRVIMETPRDVLARGPRDEASPFVPVYRFNKLMSDLGYSRLIIKSGVAFFALKKRNRPLPPEFRMETLPGETEDRIQVYTLDRVIVVLKALREYARRNRPTSSILIRIDKMIDLLMRHPFG